MRLLWVDASEERGPFIDFIGIGVVLDYNSVALRAYFADEFRNFIAFSDYFVPVIDSLGPFWNPYEVPV